MAEPENIVLEYLRRMDRRLDQFEAKLDSLIQRVSSIEGQLALMKTDETLRGGLARLDHRDQIEKRLERIERRLDLIEA